MEGGDGGGGEGLGEEGTGTGQERVGGREASDWHQAVSASVSTALEHREKERCSPDESELEPAVLTTERFSRLAVNPPSSLGKLGLLLLLCRLFLLLCNLFQFFSCGVCSSSFLLFINLGRLLGLFNDIAHDLLVR